MTNNRLSRKKAVMFIVIIAMMLIFIPMQADAASWYLRKPVLKEMFCYPSGKSYNAKIAWKSYRGKKYQILRKTAGKKYKKIATVKAKGSTCSYTNKKVGNKKYTYTVREVKKIFRKNRYSYYDKEGLTISSAAPTVSVAFGNVEAAISWTKVPGATSYRVYRKVGKTGKYRRIATLDSDRRSYVDTYAKSLEPKKYKEDKGIVFIEKTYLDPSYNALAYTVRAVKGKGHFGSRKTEYGRYLKDGDFHLESPSIVDVTEKNGKATVTWGTVPNADGYYIYTKKAGGRWNRVKEVKASSKVFSYKKNVTQYCSIKQDECYTVKAYSNKNGKTVYSGYDTGFTTVNRKYDEKILWLGDSITYGSPYYHGKDENGISPAWHRFTMPKRVDELLSNRKTASLVNETEGLKTHFYNPSIPGSTYYTPITEERTLENGTKEYYGRKNFEDSEVTKLPCNDGDKTGFDRARICDEVVKPIVEGKTPSRNEMLGTLPNTSRIKDYDVVVLSAGTNDYLDCAPLGDESNWKKLSESFKKKEGCVGNGEHGVRLNVVDRNSADYNASFDKNSFYGAYNTIMKQIEDASRDRVKNGKDPIKVVTFELFYSDRTYYNGIRTNRFVTKNDVNMVSGFGEGGHTLKDYQKCLDTLNSIWTQSPYLKLYSYKTNDTGIVTERNCPYNASDNLHFTKFTYSRFGNSIAEFFQNKVFCDSFTCKDVLENTKEKSDQKAMLTKKTAVEKTSQNQNADDKKSSRTDIEEKTGQTMEKSSSEKTTYRNDSKKEVQ